MAERRRKRKKSKKWILLIVIPVFLAVTTALVFYAFRITNVSITGSDKYTYDELYDYIFENRNDTNMLLFMYDDSKAQEIVIPFISQIDIDKQFPGTLDITVYEKSVVGYIEYKGSNMYFDKDGIIVESSTTVVPGVPCVEGLEFKSIVLYSEIDIGQEAVFSSINDIFQSLQKYQIEADKLVVSNNSEFSLVLGNVRVELGINDENMNEKIFEINCMKEKLVSMKGVLHMENHTEESDYIIFNETD